MANKAQGSDEVVYADVADGRGNRIHVYSQTYHGKTKVHVRRFWCPPDTIEWKPTKVGFALDEEAFREVMAGLMAAEEKLQW